MKVESLNIERRQSYDTDYPNMLIGMVCIKGEHGKMDVKLTNRCVSKIFKVIRDDVQRVADYNASQASEAVTEAEHEPELTEEIFS